MDEHIPRIIIIGLACGKVTLRIWKNLPSYLFTTLGRDTKLLKSHFRLERPVSPRRICFLLGCFLKSESS